MGTLKIKQTSIATVRNHLLTVARFPTPLCFRYPLPLKVHKIEIFFGFDFEICIISYVKKSKYQDFTKKDFYQAIIGGDTIFPLSLRLRGIEFSLV